MKASEDVSLIGPCGIYCGECEVYKAKDDPALMEYLISIGMKRDKLPCPGCKPIEGKCVVMDGTCDTYACVNEHNVDFCFDCQEFPCSKLNPASDRANVLPHNLKVYNLCFIKHQGVERFLHSHSDIKQKYYKGKMVIGKGPVITE